MKRTITELFTKLFSRIDPYRAFFIVTLLIAAFFRLFRLSENPVALNQDEAINGYDALSLGSTLRDHHGNFLPPMLESFGDWSSPLITYITIPFVKVLGLNEFSIRLPIALLGVGSTALIYVLIKQLFKRRDLALLGSFILATSPWDITLSRWAIPPSIVVFFLMLFLVTFLWAFKEGKKTPYWQAALVGLTAGIAVYSYPTQKMFLPLFVAAIGLVYLKGNFKKLVVSGAVFAIIIAPIFYLTLTQPEKYNARYDSVSIESTGENVPLGIVVRYFEYITPYFAFGGGDPDTMHQVPGYSNFNGVFTVFFYLGLAVLINILVQKKKLMMLDQKHAYILLAWLVLFPIAASVTKDHFMLLRVVHVFPLFILLILMGYSLVAPALPRRLLFANLFVVGLFGTGVYFGDYVTRYREESKASYNYGVKELMGYLQANESQFDTVTMDHLPIYYLYYSKYDPKAFQELLKSQKEEDRFKVIGKYNFRKVDSEVFQTAPVVYEVKDEKNIWYKIYEPVARSYVVERLK
jgi:4-amino-4-deoxy-L-arabinose transferase-like glycosyltransferase